MNELLLLRYRDLLSKREEVTARANYDLAKNGEWQENYNELYEFIDTEFELLTREIEANVKGSAVNSARSESPCNS